VAVGGLFTGAAGLGAETEGTKGRYFAVDGARARIAGGGGEKGRAGNATKLGLGGDGAGLELGASAASDGASTHGTPSRNSAIDGASFGATVARLGEELAGLATVGGSAKDGAATRLLALHVRAEGGARLGASGPLAESRHGAVDGALFGHALLFFLEGRAGVATVLALANYVANTSGLANTARLGADRPGGPARNPAVDGADTDGAGTALFGSRAGLATVAGGSENVTGTLLVTKATGLVAGRPSTEFFHEAVDGAGLFVAGNFFSGDTTEVAAELSLSDDVAGASHGTTTA